MPPSRTLRAGLIATTTIVAIVLVAIFVSLSGPRGPAASASPVPSAAPKHSLPQTPEPSVSAGSDLDLAEITWYTLVSVAFGTLTGPGPSAAPMPEGYDLLTVGTLDGHVTAQLHLSTRITEAGQEGAWANGPYGSTVLAGDDDGLTSRVFTVSSRDGSEDTLLETDDAVVVAALAEDEGAMYFVPVDRSTGIDRGLWRLALDGSAEPEVVYDDPIASSPTDYATQWTMDWSTDGDVLVTQGCRMRTCRTLVLDADTGMSRLDADGTPVIGVTDSDYVTERRIVSLASGEEAPLGLEPGGQAVLAGAPGNWHVVFEPAQQDARAYALVEAPLGGGVLRSLVEIGASEPTDARMKIGPDYGVDLPPEWVLRWPTEGGRYMDIAVPPEIWYAGEIVNVINGERSPVPPTAWPDTPAGCDPVPPVALPSGAAPGDATITGGGHQSWATWASGTPDQVVQLVGAWGYGSTLPGEELEPGTPVTIRGQPGRVVAMGSIDGPWAIAWEENGCKYEVQLLPGSNEADAVEYASRYGAEITGRPPLVVPATIAVRPEEQRMLEDLVSFAQAPDPDRLALLPFAHEVSLGLGDQVIVRRSQAELLDPAAWSLGADLAFRERVGPYSALDTLAEWNVSAAGILIREMQARVGSHKRCSSPPVPAPAELAGLRRISAHPVGDVPCLLWWTVDLFLTDDGRIAGVTLDFGDP